MSTFTPRLYQETILGTATLHNTLVVLPTGMGKTHIAMMLAAHRLKQYPKSKVVMLAPTKPLVDQHADSFAKHLPDAQSLSTVLTGKISPDKRQQEFERASFIFSTPQTIENDLLGQRISLKDVSLLIIDEAHRATGDYAYVYIAKQYRKQAHTERILALTASPGSDKQSIQEIIDNCGIEKLEVKSYDDPDVAPYVQEIDVQYTEVTLPPELLELKKVLERVLQNRLSQVQQHGHIKDIHVNKTQLLGAQRELQAEIRGGQPDQLVWRSISILAEVMKAQHALELLETQGLDAVRTYCDNMQRQAAKGQSKAVTNLMSDPDMRHVMLKADALSERGFQHPKLPKLLSIIKLELTKNPDAKIIVFNQYRDQALTIVSALKGKARLFVGQQKKGGTGLSQKEQKEMLQEFREGQFPVLVATSVGEEGLDIPAVDLVLFFEPVPSAIRTIQRRGRTGRQETGRVTILVTKGTRDEGYRWSAHHKEQRMYRTLKNLSATITPAAPKNQTLLDDFEQEEELTIIADTREKGGHVLKELQDLGINLVLKALPVGDYVLSKRVCVEFKTSEDFVNSLLDGRLLSQLRELKQYQRPILIVEGTNWYSQRNVHPNAIRGAFSAISVSFGIPVLVTQNAKDTAALLQTIAKREKDGGVDAAVIGISRSSSAQEELLGVVAALPNVGPVLAPKLLARFGSLKDLMNASVDDLKQVEGVGKKKAEELCDTFSRRFEA